MYMSKNSLEDIREYWAKFSSSYVFISYYRFSKVPYETLIAIDMSDDKDRLEYFTFEENDRLDCTYRIRPKREGEDVDPFTITVGMLILSRYGIKGEVELFTHDRYGWFIMADGEGSVQIYEGKLVYPDQPTIAVDEYG